MIYVLLMAAIALTIYGILNGASLIGVGLFVGVCAIEFTVAIYCKRKRIKKETIELMKNR